mmetsp:Transcript_53048/g.94669  ORF Transcript_53048/g.94669 Transcript_53048/m.94669 type:complete len:537 (-) Transcript_53048:3616-5226(-)
MSRLPISTNRPIGAMHLRVSAWPSPARELRTTSTPLPLVNSITLDTNSAGLRESMTMWQPISDSVLRLSAFPALPMMVQPMFLAICKAACPTPPRVEWRMTVSSLDKRATLTRACQAVAITPRKPAASAKDSPSRSGMRTVCRSLEIHLVPKRALRSSPTLVDIAKHITLSPGLNFVIPLPILVTTPAHSIPMMGLKSPSIPMASMTSLKCMEIALTFTCTSSSRTSSKSEFKGCQCRELSCPGRPTCNLTSGVLASTLGVETAIILGACHPASVRVSSWSGARRANRAKMLAAVSAVTGIGTCKATTSRPVSFLAQRQNPQRAKVRSCMLVPEALAAAGINCTMVGVCLALVTSFIKAEAAPMSARQSIMNSASARAQLVTAGRLPPITSTLRSSAAAASALNFFQQLAPQRIPPSARNFWHTAFRESPLKSASTPQTRTSQMPLTTAFASLATCTAGPVILSSMVTITSWLVRRGQLSALMDRPSASFFMVSLLPGKPRTRTTRPSASCLRTRAIKSSMSSGTGVGALLRPTNC